MAAIVKHTRTLWVTREEFEALSQSAEAGSENAVDASELTGFEVRVCSDEQKKAFESIAKAIGEFEMLINKAGGKVYKECQ